MSQSQDFMQGSMRQRLNFLGAEFLTWLYFYLEKEGGFLKLEDFKINPHLNGAHVRMGVGKRMTLIPLGYKDRKTQLVSPMLDDSGEVFSAISSGQLISSMEMELVIAERMINFAIHASDGALTQVRLSQLFEESGDVADKQFGDDKAIDDEVSAETTLLLRMSALDDLEEIVDKLFQRFLTRRLAQAFASEDIKLMKNVVAQGLKRKVPTPAPENVQVASGLAGAGQAV